MTNIIEPHGPQGSATETLARKPWKAPRLIDLDDEDPEGRPHLEGGAGLSAGNKAMGTMEGVNPAFNPPLHFHES